MAYHPALACPTQIPGYFVRVIRSLFPLFLLLSLAGCGSHPVQEGAGSAYGDGGYAGVGGGSGTFANNPAALRFAQTMQQRHGFDAKAVMSVLARAKRAIELAIEQDEAAALELLGWKRKTPAHLQST